MSLYWRQTDGRVCLEKEPGSYQHSVSLNSQTLTAKLVSTVLVFTEALADHLLLPVALGISHLNQVSNWLQDVYPPSPDEKTEA